MNKKILIVSPHPDDAAFSLAGFMLKNKEDEIVVWDVFSEQNYSINPGKETNKDEIICEEHRVMEHLGKKVILEGLKEAELRGYQRLSDILNQKIVDADQTLIAKVKEKFEKIVEQEKPDAVYFPLGSGGHIDHLIVRQAVKEFLDVDKTIASAFLYEEFPYSLNEDWVCNALKDCTSYELKQENIDVTGMQEEKAEVIGLYKSQIRDREVRKIVSHGMNIENEKMVERVWRLQ